MLYLWRVMLIRKWVGRHLARSGNRRGHHPFDARTGGPRHQGPAPRHEMRCATVKQEGQSRGRPAWFYVASCSALPYTLRFLPSAYALRHSLPLLFARHPCTLSGSTVVGVVYRVSKLGVWYVSGAKRNPRVASPGVVWWAWPVWGCSARF